MIKKKNVVERIYIAILLFIFAGIVLHAPISVGLGTLWPDYSLLIKSWKEILMLIAGILVLVLLYQKKQFRILREPLMVAVVLYAALHLVLLAYKPTGLASSLAGLAIDLRYVLYFGLVYLVVRLYPSCHKLFIKIGIVGALIVLVFAILQVFVLPADILKYIGYSNDTIAPYLTVDQNHAFIRINSTLRGPNPLGAYAGIVLSLIVAYLVKIKIKKGKWPLLFLAILSVGGVVALWFSYSRSALIGTCVAIAVVLAVTVLKRRILTNPWVIGTSILVVLIGGFLAAGNTNFVSNVLWHDNPTDTNNVNSNDGHINSLANGFNQALQQPLGAGIGSTGSASLFGDNPEIIENQYLLTAHEVGWLGLGLFIYIFGLIMLRLWRLRSDWLAIGVFASGIGLALVGLLLPVWVDDTVSIIWWGLAGLVVGRWYIVDGRTKNDR